MDTDDSSNVTPPPKLPPPYKIEFDVPCGKYSRDLTISNHYTWLLFLNEVARLMDCHQDSLLIGYILPWKIKNGSKPAPKLLDDEAAFDKLKEDVEAWRKEQTAKNKGKGVVKQFSIQLTDLRNNEVAHGKVFLII
jgi:hypothetical protein